MIRKIKVKEDTNIAKILFFKEIDLCSLPNPRIVPIFGANGAGKTTLLKALEKFPEVQNHIKYCEAKRDGGSFDGKENINQTITSLRSPKENDKMVEFWNNEIQREYKKLTIEIERDDDSKEELLYTYRNTDDNFRKEKSFDSVSLLNRWNASALSEGQSIMYSLMPLINALVPGHTDFVSDDQNAVVILDEMDSGLSLDNLDAILRKIKRIGTKRNNVQIFFSFNTSYILKYFPDVISMYDGKVHHLENEKDMLAELKANEEMLKKARKKRNGEYKIFG